MEARSDQTRYMDAAVRAPQPRPKRRAEMMTRMSLARSWTDEAATSGGFGGLCVCGRLERLTFAWRLFFTVPNPNQDIGVVFGSHGWSQSKAGLFLRCSLLMVFILIIYVVFLLWLSHKMWL